MLKTIVEKSLCVRTGLAFAALAAGLSVAALFFAVVTDAQARERDRTLKIMFTHTGEKGEFTFKRNGRYDRAVLNKLNKIMRDWRRNQPTRMDPQLFDLIWEVYQKTGSKGYIHVVSGYRSLKTNNMLRRRSRGVAKRSRHTQGRAMDFFIPGVPISKIRKIGLKLQEGGVGYYPSSRSPFVHLDTGSVRHWPRMSRRQLARVFPNGETVHVPRDGKPLRNYKRALAKLNRSAKNTNVAYLDSRTRSVRIKDDDQRKVSVGKWLKTVFAGGVDEEEDNSLSGTGAMPLDLKVAIAGASPVPMPRNVPVKTRMILLAAAERSRIATADELAMAALVSAPQTPSVRAAATDSAKARDNAARFQTASFADDDNAIAAPDRSALAALYLAAVRRAAELVPGRAPQAKPTVSQASYSLVAADPGPMPAPIRSARYLPITLPTVALPKAAPPASAAADVPGSAIEAATALGLMGTQDPQPIDPGQKIELAYAAAGAAVAFDGVAAKPRPRLKAAVADAARPASAESAGSAPAYPAVTVNAHLETAALSANGLRRFMSQTTTRTRAFALFEQPRPDRVPGFYIAPKTAAQAILPTAVRPPRTDRFAINGKQPASGSKLSRFAGLY